MSTYSPDLRIELITTGDQAGTWGATTNTNLAYVIEQAIAGYISVSVTSANQALTYINGGSSTAALNQSVHAALALTTTTGANFAVYAPPASKQYTIYNASSYTATIYNSSVIGNTTAAGTGVAIPAGKTMTVWSDGTNFAVQNSHIIGTVVGNVTGNVTGNLDGNLTATAPTASTAAPGTNTTQIATTAFVTAALQAAYPVGSIYINAGVTTNPATLLGFGTWTAFGAGQVMVGLNGADPLFDTLEETGGSKDATTVSHTHTYSGTTGAVGNHQHESGSGVESLSAAFGLGTNSTGYRISLVGASANTPLTSNAGAHDHSFSGTTASTGSSGTNANLQPYITVAMWKRTA
jgi:hypothetical protein